MEERKFLRGKTRRILGGWYMKRILSYSSWIILRKSLHDIMKYGEARSSKVSGTLEQRQISCPRIIEILFKLKIKTLYVFHSWLLKRELEEDMVY